MITFTAVRKSYGRHEVLNIPAIEVSAGIHWLKGSNGAGKTTFLRTLAGMLPYEGDICIGETSMRATPVAYRRLINYAEAEPLYPDFMRGSELIELFEQAKGAPAGQSAALIAAFHMSAWVEDNVGTYSSGMLKKLSLVLGFIGRAQVILLDEPLVTLEDHSVPVLGELIRQAHAGGTTFILTSHQPLDSLELTLHTTYRIIDKTLVAQ